MPLRDELDSLTARRFRTGRACLDFVHTGGVGRWTDAELLHDNADAAFWLALVLDLDRDQVLARPVDLGPLRELREALWQLAQAAVTSRPFAVDHVEAVNASAACAPLRPLLTIDGQRRIDAPVTAEQALSALARDAIDLFGGPQSARIRTCAADDCELLFVDTSRPGHRRWCSMERCGSRAKMRRHRAG